jgi:hypothetical protein
VRGGVPAGRALQEWVADWTALERRIRRIIPQ